MALDRLELVAPLLQERGPVLSLSPGFLVCSVGLMMEPLRVLGRRR